MNLKQVLFISGVLIAASTVGAFNAQEMWIGLATLTIGGGLIASSVVK